MEKVTPANIFSTVKDVVSSKAWYGFDPDTGAFDWNKSIGKITEELGATGMEEKVREAFASAFSPDCLNQVTLHTPEGQSVKMPLVEGIRNEGLEQFIWTVGDEQWQREKYIRTGTNMYIPEDHYRCVPSDKLTELRKMLTELKARERKSPVHVLVVDDKIDHADFVKTIAGEYEENSFTVGDYHMKLKDNLANGQAFYEFVIDYRKSNPYSELIIIFDFDGVVADTDSVIFGRASDNLAKLLSQ